MSKLLTPLGLDAYRAQSDRIAKLADFLGRFAPAPSDATGGGFDAGTPLDADAPPDVLEARTAAVLAAFDAVREIADNS